MPINLVICCRNYLFSEGLKKLLENERDINFIGRYNSKADLKEIEKHNPDVILSDIETFFDFFSDIPSLKQRKILLIQNSTQSPSINEQLLDILISKGVAGILPADTDSSVLKKAIRSVFEGELWLPHKSIKAILHRNNNKKSNLTRQENEIAFYICKGYRNKEIAKKLNISEQTVKSHCNRIYKKFGVSDRLQLALMMLKSNHNVKE